MLSIFSRLAILSLLAASSISCQQGITGNSATKDELFITLPATDSLVIVDPAQKKQTSRLKLGKLPHNIRLSANGKKLYVVLVGSQAIAEIDIASRELIRTFLTESVPIVDDVGLSIEPHVSQQADSHNSCFNCHNGRADGAKPAIVGSRPFGIALTEDNQLLVANTLTATVNYIDLDSGTIVKSLDIVATGDAQEPTELAIIGDRLYVTVRPVLPSLSPSVLRVYGLRSGVLLSESPVGSAVTALEIDASNALLYTTNFESNTLDKFGPDGELIESFIVGDGPFGINQQGDSLLVANFYDNSISRINLLEKNVVTQKLQTAEQQFANPTHMNLSLDARRIYLISGGTNGFLLTLDSKTLEIVSDMQIGGLPFDIVNINKQ